MGAPSPPLSRPILSCQFVRSFPHAVGVTRTGNQPSLVHSLHLDGKTLKPRPDDVRRSDAHGDWICLLVPPLLDAVVLLQGTPWHDDAISTRARQRHKDPFPEVVLRLPIDHPRAPPHPPV